MKFNRLVLAALSVTALTLGNNALAQTTTGSMKVDAFLIPGCVFDVKDIYFPTITDQPGVEFIDAAPTSLKITCTKTTAYTMTFSAGKSANFANRTMRSSSSANTDSLNYNLYKDSAKTIVLGDSTVANGSITGVGTGTLFGTYIYAAVPGGQYRTPDRYQDNITVTLSY